MTISVNDAGTWRSLVNVYVNDSGTWRDIQEVYVNDGGTWRSVFRRTSVFTGTAGFGTDGIVVDFRGYVLSPATGSISPSGSNNLLGTYTISQVLDDYAISGGSYLFSGVQISGFGADPGQNGFFTSVQVGAVNRTSAGATGYGPFGLPAYSYSGGIATWIWNTGAFGFVGGVGYTFTVNF